MNYWLAGTSFGEKNHLDDFVEYSYWEGGDVAKSNIMNAIKSVKKGDVIIAKTTGKKGPGHSISCIRIKAIGVIASDIHVVDDGNNWYQCKVVWKKLSEDREFEGSAYGKYLGTMHLCMENEIKTFAMQCLKADGRVFENVLKYVESLKVSKNIILHGAPGTGKTYLAREIAKAMGCTKDEMEFVQFHPSYDYTDFVEGLRPT
ncbi:MAG: AAA family ATPase, partial [Fibrobacteraceae bacterium]|nr:AAA family ATPase [Fibrobacteraceae bacterium]